MVRLASSQHLQLAFLADRSSILPHVHTTRLQMSERLLFRCDAF